MSEMPKVKLIRQIIIGLVCLLFLVSPVFSFAADTQLELQMSPFPAPTNLTATVVGSDRIDLSWSVVSIAISYKIYRAGVLIASPVTNSYSDTGLSSGTTYSYTVSGVNADGVESQSSFVSATTTAQGGGMPLEWHNPPAPPAGGFRIIINNDARYTNNTVVTLSLIGGPNTERMAISNFSDFRDAGQEIYTSTKIWDLCKGFASCLEGEYTVYAKFYTPWGRSSEVVSDSIISIIYKKSVGKLIVEEIQRKLVEIAKRISDLRKQINQLFQKKAVVEVPKIPEEKISPEKAPPEQILPPVGEFPKKEIITPPEKEKVRTEPINLLKEYRKWFWQKISNFWQKIWPF